MKTKTKSKGKSKSLYNHMSYSAAKGTQADIMTQQNKPGTINTPTTDTTQIPSATTTTTTASKGDKASSAMGYASAASDLATGIAGAVKTDTSGKSKRAELLRKKARNYEIAATTVGAVGGALSGITWGISGAVGGGVAAGLVSKANKLKKEAAKEDIAFVNKQKSLAAERENVLNALQPAPNVMPEQPGLSNQKPFVTRHGSKALYNYSHNRGTSGIISGKGNDKETAALRGGMVIPVHNVARFLQSPIAKQFGLTGKKADHKQPGGDRGYVTGGEYYVDQNTVNAIIKAGLQKELQSFAPNAKESVGPGVKAGGGTLADPLFRRQRNQFSQPWEPKVDLLPDKDSRVMDLAKKGMDFNPFDYPSLNLSGLAHKPLISKQWEDGRKRYDKVVVKNDNLTDEEKMMNRALTLNNVATGLNTAAGLGSLFWNISKDYKPGTYVHTPVATPLSEHMDTTDQENDVKGMFLAARKAYVEQGGNPALFPMQQYMRELGRIKSEAERYRFMVRNRNAEATDSSIAANIAGINQFNREEQVGRAAFRGEKSAAITKNIEELLQLPYNNLATSLAIRGYKDYI